MLHPTPVQELIEARKVPLTGYYPTKEIVDRICALLKGGLLLPQAAKKVGLRPTTVMHWMRTGREEPDHGPYADALNKIESAMIEAEQEHLDNIRMAGEKDWRSSAWFLERTRPSIYGTQKAEIAALKKQVRMLQEKLAEVLGLTLPQVAAADDVPALESHDGPEIRIPHESQQRSR